METVQKCILLQCSVFDYRTALVSEHFYGAKWQSLFSSKEKYTISEQTRYKQDSVMKRTAKGKQTAALDDLRQCWTRRRTFSPHDNSRSATSHRTRRRVRRRFLCCRRRAAGASSSCSGCLSWPGHAIDAQPDFSVRADALAHVIVELRVFVWRQRSAEDSSLHWPCCSASPGIFVPFRQTEGE